MIYLGQRAIKNYNVQTHAHSMYYNKLEVLNFGRHAITLLILVKEHLKIDNDRNVAHTVILCLIISQIKSSYVFLLV